MIKPQMSMVVELTPPTEMTSYLPINAACFGGDVLFGGDKFVLQLPIVPFVWRRRSCSLESVNEAEPLHNHLNFNLGTAKL